MLRTLLAVVLLALAPCSAAWGQAWPAKPIRIIVPFGPGGPDSLARILGPQLSAQMGQPVVVENKPGANGVIGAEAVAKSAPDGYTLMITSSGFVVAPSMYRKLPYDTEKDFAPITDPVESGGVFVAVNTNLPVNTLQDLVDLAKKPGAKLSFGSPGVGNTLHLAGELFNARAGTNMLHIPYKGAGPAVAAAVSGETQVVFSTPPAVIGQIKGGKLRALAYTGTKRHPQLPDVPTAAEAGLPAFTHSGGWFGFFAPAGTPPEIIDRLYAETKAAFANPQFRERIAVLGADPGLHTPAEFRKLVGDDIKRYAELVRIANIEPE